MFCRSLTGVARLALISLFGFSLSASAELIRFDFTGKFTDVLERDNYLGGNLHVGDTFHSSFVFDLQEAPWQVFDTAVYSSVRLRALTSSQTFGNGLSAEADFPDLQTWNYKTSPEDNITFNGDALFLRGDDIYFYSKILIPRAGVTEQEFEDNFLGYLRAGIIPNSTFTLYYFQINRNDGGWSADVGNPLVVAHAVVTEVHSEILQQPVPEPSTYGFAALLFFAGLVAVRSHRRKT